MKPSPVHVQKPLITWILTADGDQANIYDYVAKVADVPLEGGNKHHATKEIHSHCLAPVEHGSLKALSIETYQIGHDRRGRSSSSNSSTHNTYEPHGDIGQELRRRFIKSIAGKLLDGLQNDRFDQLILAAASKMMGELKEALGKKFVHIIIGELPKDLMHYHGNDLLHHLDKTLIEARLK